MKKGKVAVALSGGVDSGVAAALVVKAGNKAAGFHMHLWAEPVTSYQSPVTSFQNKCCSTESLEAARKTADQLGIPFYKVDFLEEIFKKRVVDYFLKEYGLGRTPNPCVMCNRFIKFGELMDYAKNLGYDYLVTGHYARVVKRETQNVRRKTKKNVSPITYHLLRARDEQKDQSYFLYNLTQKKLAQVMFPVGDYQKSEVIKMAKKWKLPVAERPESQEICFYPEKDYRPFLKRQIKGKIIPGKVVNIQGKVIGEHQGLPLYTIGQRHGFEIRTKNKEQRTKGLIPPYYVVRKDVKNNQLVVGFGKEAERKKFWVKEVNWIDPNLQFTIYNLQLLVRIRHQGELLGCRLQVVGNRVKVVLDEPERGVAPGQAAVFYQQEEVLGGGIIGIDPAKSRGA